jgi:hypothetical protein
VSSERATGCGGRVIFACVRWYQRIGGIGVFLPFSQEEEKVCAADGAAEEQSQLTMTVREEEGLEQTLEASQVEAEADEEKDEHSEEWLNIFSQDAEKTATGEFASKKEGADSICFSDLWEHIEALEERVKVQSVHIQQVKLEAEEGGMGDHDDLPMCQKNLQLRRLHEQDQPWEQLDEVIKEIMELMIRSAETSSKEQLSRRKAAAAQQEQQQ